MAQNETWLSHDLMNPVKVQYLDGNLFSMDNAGNLIGVTLTKDGVAYSGGGSVSANVIRADGGTVAVSGALSGNVATVVLPQAAYAVPGVASIVVKLTISGEITTIAAVVANVYESTTSATIDPGTIIPSIQTLISQIDTAVSSIPADYSSLWASLAPAFSTSTAYTAGQYVTYNGGLYRFITDHAAGSWSSSDVSSAKLGNDIAELKSAIDVTLGTGIIPVTDTAKAIDCSGTSVTMSEGVPQPTTAYNYCYRLVSCVEGDQFVITGAGGSTSRLFAFVKSNGEIIIKANASTTETNRVVTAPADSAWFIMNAKTANTNYAYNTKNILGWPDNLIIGTENVFIDNSAATGIYADLDKSPIDRSVFYTSVNSDHVAHLPITPFSGYVTTIQYLGHGYGNDKNFSIQIAQTCDTSNRIFIRSRVASWNEWTEIVVDNVLDAAKNNLIIGTENTFIKNSTSTGIYTDMDTMPVDRIVLLTSVTSSYISHLPITPFTGYVTTIQYQGYGVGTNKNFSIQFAQECDGVENRLFYRSRFTAWNEWTEIKSEETAIDTYKGLKNFTVMGDSVSVSWSTPAVGEAYEVKSWARYMAESMNRNVDIFAHGGWATGTWIASDEYANATANTNNNQFAVIALGINDANNSVSSETFTTNYTKIVNDILATHKFVFCCTIPEGLKNSARATYNTIIKSVAESITGAFVADVDAFSSRISPYCYLGHMSSTGYPLLAHYIEQAINKAIANNDYFVHGKVDQPAT